MYVNHLLLRMLYNFDYVNVRKMEEVPIDVLENIVKIGGGDKWLW